jgi:RimJ/RimL family protein N-acetyltransferase
MIFKEGKIIDKFFVNKDGKKIEVILRYPKMSDAHDYVSLLNSLIDESARIMIINKVTLKQEKEFLKSGIKNIKSCNEIQIVVEIDGQAVGNCSISKGFGTFSHIGTFGIILSKEYRGLGIGRKLAKTTIEIGKKQLKLKIAKLGVAVDNKNANEMYKQLGFKTCGKMPYGMKTKNNKYVDEILMYKVLK